MVTVKHMTEGQDFQLPTNSQPNLNCSTGRARIAYAAHTWIVPSIQQAIIKPQLQCLRASTAPCLSTRM